MIKSIKKYVSQVKMVVQGVIDMQNPFRKSFIVEMNHFGVQCKMLHDPSLLHSKGYMVAGAMRVTIGNVSEDINLQTKKIFDTGCNIFTDQDELYINDIKTSTQKSALMKNSSNYFHELIVGYEIDNSPMKMAET